MCILKGFGLNNVRFRKSRAGSRSPSRLPSPPEELGSDDQIDIGDPVEPSKDDDYFSGDGDNADYRRYGSRFLMILSLFLAQIAIVKRQLVVECGRRD